MLDLHLLDQIDRLQQYQKERRQDYEYTSTAKDRLTTSWTNNLGIQQRLEDQLRARAVGIDEAIKRVGKGIDFEGYKVE